MIKVRAFEMLVVLFVRSRSTPLNQKINLKVHFYQDTGDVFHLFCFDFANLIFLDPFLFFMARFRRISTTLSKKIVVDRPKTNPFIKN